MIPSAGPPNTKQYKEFTTSEKIRKRQTKHNLLLSVGLLQTQKYFSVSGTHDAVLMVVVHLTFLLPWSLLQCIVYHFLNSANCQRNAQPQTIYILHF